MTPHQRLWLRRMTTGAEGQTLIYTKALPWHRLGEAEEIHGTLRLTIGGTPDGTRTWRLPNTSPEHVPFLLVFYSTRWAIKHRITPYFQTDLTHNVRPSGLVYGWHSKFHSGCPAVESLLLHRLSPQWVFVLFQSPSSQTAAEYLH
jgi:hypothetical protein